ncbi:16S rRNA (adenine(1518)-N(6)/adenine(1519)-N(6))-dimethyltransferase RsmA [Acidipropionibacterium acidipropionici]|jgi:16S rRNA (adenine1518-N6/adenine1519-N6)-dimethyltransferase|uniref:Ribosomal RNA small subunit methyltransferase A n=1 Tax=Acidipropionibacterium acidipropionici TaxID=1748 RepID=A0AAC9AP46_9ACTN|nr:16S rRNA (adenine(1518)-N(6)/adenine(1519)-N(6))-dimethyltransferase RsmA [Acidipropionibacterium acidipropionici]AMS06564.1 16S rRNA methyltransferase [Acidipropionibacterium acidipropionici]AOZ48006.1 16S rRNA (adenine(1518)-N(6)/adenine(1519)-N(6))-dimethyltransferase [Acidipropionibacterium acidipropionici]AZP38644.1 16S rRNA (adenine(1518)-N(6)/adenine(1519)-N(6))-dimethyltransferase RsmA [Acidipropionibacterium acidipropionici]
MSALLGPREIRELAARIGLRPTKTRGQNFVHDANTVRRIVAAAGIDGSDRVVEVGPGLGSLTLGLLETGARVVAIELDDVLAAQLPVTVAERMPDAADRLTLITGDALKVDRLPLEPTALVANLPYNVSVPVLLHLLEISPEWTTGLVMVQLEVADRLVAGPGTKVYGVPSAKLAWYARAERIGTVPASVFWPVPNVESGLVRITRRDPPATSATREQVFGVVDGAFANRRKMLRAACAPMCGGSARASELIAAAGIDPTLRGEALRIDEFARIADQIARPR